MQVSIVTPYRKLVEDVRADSIKLPGSKGQIEVLEDHANLVSTMTTGEVIFGGRKFAVSCGFVEIKDGHVTLLAETCEESTEIDVERAQRAQKKAEELLGSTLQPGDFRKYELKLQRAMLRQKISGR